MNKLAKVTIISFLVMAISCEDNEADKDPLPEFGSISTGWTTGWIFIYNKF